jgi:hypothetical protein
LSEKWLFYRHFRARLEIRSSFLFAVFSHFCPKQVLPVFCPKLIAMSEFYDLFLNELRSFIRIKYVLTSIISILLWSTWLSTTCSFWKRFEPTTVMSRIRHLKPKFSGRPLRFVALPIALAKLCHSMYKFMQKTWKLTSELCIIHWNRTFFNSRSLKQRSQMTLMPLIKQSVFVGFSWFSCPTNCPPN